MNSTPDPMSAALSGALLVVPSAEKQKANADYWLSLVQAMPVTSPEEYELAANELRSLAGQRKGLDDDRQKFTGPLNTLLKEVNARYQPYIKLLEQAETSLRGKMSAFQVAEEQRVEAERQEAERKAREEREEAERAAEAARKAAEAAQAAADAATSAKKRKAAEEAAAVAQAQAQAAAAAAEAAMVAPALPVVPAAKAAGVGTRKTLAYEVTDLQAFLAFVFEKRPDLVGAIQLDSKIMRAAVTVQGEATRFPGVRVFYETGITVR